MQADSVVTSRMLERWITFVILAGASALLGLIYPINDDDIYHLQSMWMTAHGYLPYRDFQANHPPGPWVILAPWAWTWSLFDTSTIVIQARLLVAAGFGFAGVLASSLVSATGLRLTLLIVLLLGVLAKCMVFLFRIEDLVVPLLWLHLWLLARIDTAHRPAVVSLLAAAAIGLAGTMSVRVGILLLIQPLFLLVMLLRYHRPWAIKAFAFWLLGGLLAVTPTLCYLAARDLWSETWLWCVVYPSTLDVVRWHAPTDIGDFLLIAVAVAALAVLSREERLPLASRWALGLGFAVNLLWYLVNPFRGVDYANVHMFMAWSALLAVVPFTLLHKVGITLERFVACFTRRRLAVGVTVSLVLVALVAWRQDRAGGWPMVRVRNSIAARHMQSELLDWLQQISDGESVLLIDPYHPITANNATFLRSRWVYRAYTKNRIVAPHLAGLTEQIIAARPAVIAKLPHPDSTISDLFGWLEKRAIISSADAEELRALIARDYVEVEFPTLNESASGLDFGYVYWVRKDRLTAHTPPDPYLAHAPFSISAVSAAAPQIR